MRIEHPGRAGIHAICGYSSTHGLFIEVWDDGQVTYHGSATTGSAVPLREILWLLVERGFFGWADIHLAQRQLQRKLAEEIDDSDVRRAAEVLDVLKSEASR